MSINKWVNKKLNLLKEKNFEVVVLDSNMPNHYWFDVFKWTPKIRQKKGQKKDKIRLWKNNIQHTQLVIEILKEEKTITQISSEHGIQSSQLYKWKTQAVEKIHTLFENDNKTEKAHQVEQERKINELNSEIRRLSTQLAWLKNKSGIDCC